MLEEIAAWAGKTVEIPSDAYRAMTPEELNQLEDGGLMEVGAHTVNHPQLSFQTPEVQREEIFSSKADLEDMVNHRVGEFSYPYGGHSDVTISLVEEAGYDHSVSTHQESVWHRSRPFEIPRIEITNISGEEFEKRLSGWLNS